MEQINLNIIPNGAMPVCHVSQYDKGRTIRLNLFDGDNVYTLTGGETLELDVKKPDTTIVTANVVNTSDTYVEIVTTEQMAACSGNNFCELRISMGGAIIGSLNFIMACEKSPLEGGVESESAIENLDTQVAALVAEEVASQYDASDVIFDSEPTEGHGIGFAVTSEGVFNAINNVLDIEEEAGPASIVSFDNAAALPVVDLIANIMASGGGGTPSTPIAINGFDKVNVWRGGINLFDKTTATTGGWLNANGGVNSGSNRAYSDYIAIKLNQPYYFEHVIGSNSLTTCIIYDSNKTIIGQSTLTGSTNISGTLTFTAGAFIRVNTTTDKLDEMQISLGSTAPLEYHAYNGNIFTVNFGQTVYGGTVDMVTGKCFITHGLVDLGSLTWYRTTSYQNPVLYTNVSQKAIKAMNLICEAFPFGGNFNGAQTFAQTVDNNTIANCPQNIQIFVRADAYTDAATFKTAMSGVYLVYELATPTEIQLTPTEVKTLLGENNIYSDTGDIERIVYFKDSAQAIADLINIILNEIDS